MKMNIRSVPDEDGFTMNFYLIKDWLFQAYLNVVSNLLHQIRVDSLLFQQTTKTTFSVILASKSHC